MAPRTKERTLREGEELWETTTDAVIWLMTTYNRNGQAQEKATQFGGKAGSPVRIKTIDRLMAMELAIEGPSVFESGLLRRVDQRVSTIEDLREDPTPVDDDDEERIVDGGPQALTDAELKSFFGTNGNTFKARVRALNELGVRRMKAMCTPNEAGHAEVDARATEIAFLNEIIEEKYRVGGSTPTNDDLRLSARADAG